MQKQQYENVGTLDIREANEEIIKNLIVGNVGLIITSKESKHLLSHIHCGNIGNTVELNGDFKLINGTMKISKSSGTDQELKTNFVLNGKLIISNDLTEKELESRLGQLLVNGKIIVPQSLVPILQKKVIQLNGKLDSYPDHHILFEAGKRINRNFLSTLPDSSQIAILGNTTFSDDIDKEILEQKLKSLFVSGTIFCFAKTTNVIMSLLHENSKKELDAVPDGYKVIYEPLKLDRLQLETWSPSKLYFLKTVEFAKDIDKSLFDEKIISLIAKEKIYCPELLKQLVHEKLENLNNNVTSYKENLLIIEDNFTIWPSTLKFMTGFITIANDGELCIDKAIDAQLLFDRIHKIYNYGTIKAQEEQIGAIQAKLEVNEGELIDSSSTTDKIEDGVGNIGYLKL